MNIIFLHSVLQTTTNCSFLISWKVSKYFPNIEDFYNDTSWPLCQWTNTWISWKIWIFIVVLIMMSTQNWRSLEGLIEVCKKGLSTASLNCLHFLQCLKLHLKYILRNMKIVTSNNQIFLLIKKLCLHEMCKILIDSRCTVITF